MDNLTEKAMRSALLRIDELLATPVILIIGSGGAMILAHGVAKRY